VCFVPQATSVIANREIISGSTRHGARALRRRDGLSAAASLALHWPEYMMEAAELGLYMFLTCAFATLLQHPASPVRHLIPNVIARRAVMGVAMGLTIVAIVMSPWGKQSGGHFNPAITLTFYRLGKVEFWDSWFYVIAQFVGAIGGVCLARYVLQGALGDDAVRYAVTVPGVFGRGIAFGAELTISFILMITILFVTNRDRLERYTPFFAGALIAIYIAFETPLSGMSTNPARTFSSALHAGYWQALWIYFVAPTMGMLAAGEVYLRTRGGVAPYCGKLHHSNNKRCIFIHGEPRAS
jgi:aquaporin Z